MASKTQVSGAAVREWATSEAGQTFLTEWAAQVEGREVPTVGTRGKFSADLIAAFHKAHPRQVYTTKLVRKVEVKGTRVSESGRKTPVTVKATYDEIRSWAKENGHEVGERGRVSSTVLAAFAARPKVTA